jgi:hypothetical protein
MAQVNIRPNDAATYVGAELGGFGVTPDPMVRCSPISGSVEISTTPTILDNESESVYLYDRLPTVHGFRDGEIKMGYYLKVPTGQLNAAATPAPAPLNGLFIGALGAIQVDAGSTVSASTTSSVTVDTGHGSRFPVGTVGFAEVDGAMEPFYVTARTDDALTPWPHFSAAPTETTGIVINSYTHYARDIAPVSFSIHHAMAGDADHQWKMIGCMATGLELVTERNALMRANFTFAIGDYGDSPSNQGVSTAVGGDGMSLPFALKDSIVFFQPVATTTRSHLALRSINASINLGNEYKTELGGAVQGKSGIVRTGVRNAFDMTIQLSGSDVSYLSAFNNHTVMRLVILLPSGSGLTRRFVGLVLPHCTIRERPRTVKENLVFTELVLQAQIDNTAPTPLARSPFLVVMG